MGGNIGRLVMKDIERECPLPDNSLGEVISDEREAPLTSKLTPVILVPEFIGKLKCVNEPSPKTVSIGASSGVVTDSNSYPDVLSSARAF